MGAEGMSKALPHQSRLEKGGALFIKKVVVNPRSPGGEERLVLDVDIMESQFGRNTDHYLCGVSPESIRNNFVVLGD